MSWDVNEKAYKRLKEALERLLHKVFLQLIHFGIMRIKIKGYRLEIKADSKRGIGYFYIPLGLFILTSRRFTVSFFCPGLDILRVTS